MTPLNSAVLTGLVVVLGQWSENKKLSIRVVIGVTVLAIFLSILDSTRADLAKAFGVLILVGAVLRYGVPLTKKLGLK
jgi:hypothetical protein